MGTWQISRLLVNYVLPGAHILVLEPDTGVTCTDNALMTQNNIPSL